LAVSTDEGVQIWTTDSWEHVLLIPNRRNFSFSPDSSLLAATGDPFASVKDPEICSDNSTVEVWNIAHRDRQSAFAGAGPLAWSPDGALLACRAAGRDETALWQAADNQIHARLPGGLGRLRSMQFSPDGRLLVQAYVSLNRPGAGSANGESPSSRPAPVALRIWDLKRQQAVEPLDLTYEGNTAPAREAPLLLRLLGCTPSTRPIPEPGKGVLRAQFLGHGSALIVSDFHAGTYVVDWAAGRRVATLSPDLCAFLVHGDKAVVFEFEQFEIWDVRDPGSPQLLWKEAWRNFPWTPLE
jgi:WD40 repeat protein